MLVADNILENIDQALSDAPDDSERARLLDAIEDGVRDRRRRLPSEREDYPISTCGCGHEITYYGADEGWQHNVAPYVWGDDHDAEPEEDGKRAAEAYDREHSTYSIKRFYQGDYETEVIATGLSYEDAVAHCNDPETSSKTTTNAAGLALTRERGEWFDGHERE